MTDSDKLAIAITALREVAKDTMLIAGDGESALSCCDTPVPSPVAIIALEALTQITRP